MSKPYFTQTNYKFPDRLRVAGSDSAFVSSSTGSDSAFVSSSTAAELQFKRNPAIDVAADCLAARRRNFEADSAAPWQRAPPLDNVQVAAVRAAWHESRPLLRAPRSVDATPCFSHDVIRERKEGFHSHNINTQTIFKFPGRLIGGELQYHVRRLYSRRAAVHQKSSHRRGCGLPRCTSPKL